MKTYLDRYREHRAKGERAQTALRWAKAQDRDAVRPFHDVYLALAQCGYPASRLYAEGAFLVQVDLSYDEYRERENDEYGTWSDRWAPGCLTRRQYHSGADPYGRRQSFDYWHPPEWLVDHGRTSLNRHAADCERRARIRRHIGWERERETRYGLDCRVCVYLTHDDDDDDDAIYERWLDLGAELSGESDVLDALLDLDPVADGLHRGEQWMKDALAAPGTDDATRAVRALLRLSSDAA